MSREELCLLVGRYVLNAIMKSGTKEDAWKPVISRVKSVLWLASYLTTRYDGSNSVFWSLWFSLIVSARIAMY